MSTSAVLIAFGIICLCLSAFTLYKLIPREGQPPLPDSRETSMALCQFTLLVAGIALLVKGIF